LKIFNVIFVDEFLWIGAGFVRMFGFQSEEHLEEEVGSPAFGFV